MRMFRKEKYPLNIAQGQDADYTAENKNSTDTAFAPDTEEGATAVGEENINARINVPAERRNGAVRVMLAARSLFPGAYNDEEALNLFMDLFDEKIKAEVAKGEAAAGAGSEFQALRRDEEKLRKIIPGFSLAKAFENEEFKRLVLEQGADLFTAYELLNPSLVKGERGVIDEVGGSAYAATPGSSSSDISGLSKAEFNKYIKNILEEE